MYSSWQPSQLKSNLKKKGFATFLKLNCSSSKKLGKLLEVLNETAEEKTNNDKVNIDKIASNLEKCKVEILDFNEKIFKKTTEKLSENDKSKKYKMIKIR